MATGNPTKLPANDLYIGEVKVGGADGGLFDKGISLTANRAILSTAGVTKACLVNGLTVIAGGTGIADLTLAAPVVGARAVLRLASITSGAVVVTTAAGVTVNGTNNTMTFNAAEDVIALIYKAANTWEIEMNVSVALSTV